MLVELVEAYGEINRNFKDQLTRISNAIRSAKPALPGASPVRCSRPYPHRGANWKRRVPQQPAVFTIPAVTPVIGPLIVITPPVVGPLIVVITPPVIGP